MDLNSLTDNPLQGTQQTLLFTSRTETPIAAALRASEFGYAPHDGANSVRFDSHNGFLSEALSATGGSEPAQPSTIQVNQGLRGFVTSGDAEDRAQSLRTRFLASSYVPLDSWIYDAFDRLAALGYIQTSSATIRPWTRLESARLLAEAHGNAEEEQFDDSPKPLLAALDMEFAHETSVMNGTTNTGAQVESAYDRFTGIAGTALRDSFHFAQTLTDDFGRPYGQGANDITGVSTRAEVGFLSFYLRGEYQYAAAMPTYNATAQAAIAAYDGLPFGWNLRFGTTGRIRLLEGYAVANLSNWQISFGQQSLWWGPDKSTSLILSNNASAMPMLRLTRVKPFFMPGWLRVAGPVHFDSFFSREGGIHYVALGSAFTLHGDASHGLTPPPYMWGIAFSFKPTPNFELGFAHTTIFAGYGRPLNLRTFLHSFSILGNGQAIDPGKRTTEFNLNYHVPGFRRIVLYSEQFAYDNPVEGKYLARFAMDPGIYITELPVLNKLDLRVEGVYTNLPHLRDNAYFYGNAHYPQGYTNYGQILGSWVGRQGSGGQASSTYWFSARNKATVTYRKMYADKSYLQGGNLTDVSGSLTWLIRPEIEFSALGQYEKHTFPLLETGAKSNFTTTFEVRVFPKSRVGSK
jgi:hypothetical protein